MFESCPNPSLLCSPPKHLTSRDVDINLVDTNSICPTSSQDSRSPDRRLPRAAAMQPLRPQGLCTTAVPSAKCRCRKGEAPAKNALGSACSPSLRLRNLHSPEAGTAVSPTSQRGHRMNEAGPHSPQPGVLEPGRLFSPQCSRETEHAPRRGVKGARANNSSSSRRLPEKEEKRIKPAGVALRPRRA